MGFVGTENVSKAGLAGAWEAGGVAWAGAPENATCLAPSDQAGRHLDVRPSLLQGVRLLVKGMGAETDVLDSGHAPGSWENPPFMEGGAETRVC